VDIKNTLEIDISKKLEITISNKKPVALTDLTLSLLSFDQQFQKFIETDTNKDHGSATELYIKEVRSGSIVIELVSKAISVVPLFWEGGSLTEWINLVKSIMDWFLGKSEQQPRDLSKQDLQQWNSIIEPIAKDAGSQMNFSVSDNGKVINQFFINSQEASAAQNNIRRLIEEHDAPNDHIHSRKVMYWHQAKFDRHSATGDKAVIEGISKKALKVIFENNAVKDAMLAGDSRFDKPWHELAYVVDVEVQTIKDVPKMYTILRYYAENTFDPED
jgi:hypothetical protein